MARSHHRKKHKSHLRQYQQHGHEQVAGKAKRKAAQVFAIVGGVAGLAIGYFAADRSLLWMIMAVLAGVAGGYIFGRSIDRQGKNQQ